jgi:hypothetical protein
MMTNHSAKKTGDVLSSLRRIVSADPGEPLAPTKSHDLADKLILSPAQRVTPTRPNSTSPIPTLVLSNSLEAKVSQLEDIISRLDDTWEPDGTEAQNDYSGQDSKALDWARVADAPRDEFDVVMQDNIEQQQKPLATFDEEELAHLRAIVAQIVRDELKGQLGEKITTNLRKMVRREIALALKDTNIN